MIIDRTTTGSLLRRRFARAAIAAGILATATLAGNAPAQVPGVALISVSSLLGQLYPDPACSEEHVVGACFCGSIPCGVRIERYVPVAFVETTRAPGDSLITALSLPGALPGMTASSALSSTDNTAEAHVWTLPDGPLPGISCLTCSAASAASPARVDDPAASVVACGASAIVADATLSVAAGITGPWLPRLSYASELDAANWRTGCRDRANPAMNIVSRLLDCANAFVDVVAGNDTGCLGRWGPLVPRQMRDIGPSPLLYSAKTAVRAMSIAREQIGTFPYPVDTRGKLQQAYPQTSACFRVGDLPLPQAPVSPRPAVASPDGRYGWIYWRPTTCCVGYGVARQCLRVH
jgi:hypothetical protein